MGLKVNAEDDVYLLGYRACSWDLITVWNCELLYIKYIYLYVTYMCQIRQTCGFEGSEVEVGTGGLEDGIPQRGPGAEHRWRSGSEAPRIQKPDIYKHFVAVKCFSTQVCCRVRPPSSLLPKNSSDLSESHDPTRPGQGGHVRLTVLAVYF